MPLLYSGLRQSLLGISVASLAKFQEVSFTGENRTRCLRLL
jgi:hypothetical protein